MGGFCKRGLLYGFDNLAEHRRVLLGHLGEHLAVDSDVLRLQHADEAAVAQTKHAHGSVDLEVPQVAERALLGAAVAEGVHASLEHGRAGEADLALAAPAVALHARK